MFISTFPICSILVWSTTDVSDVIAFPWRPVVRGFFAVFHIASIWFCVLFVGRVDTAVDVVLNSVIRTWWDRPPALCDHIKWSMCFIHIHRHHTWWAMLPVGRWVRGGGGRLRRVVAESRGCLTRVRFRLPYLCGKWSDSLPWPRISVKVCRTLLPQLKFSVVPMVRCESWTEWATDPFFLCYSDDNKKNTFNNSGNNGHGLKSLRVNRPLWNKRREAWNCVLSRPWCSFTPHTPREKLLQHFNHNICLISS